MTAEPALITRLPSACRARPKGRDTSCRYRACFIPISFCSQCQPSTAMTPVPNTHAGEAGAKCAVFGSSSEREERALCSQT